MATVSKLLIRLQKFSSKISTVVDATASFNANNNFYQDLSGWDSAVVQFGTIAGEGTITFYTTNDDGSVNAGQLLPAPEVPDNFIPVKGVDLATKGDVLVASNDSMVEFGIIGKYLSLSGDTMTYPLSYAYVLSKNTYTSPQEAYDLGILQGVFDLAKANIPVPLELQQIVSGMLQNVTVPIEVQNQEQQKALQQQQ